MSDEGNKFYIQNLAQTYSLVLGGTKTGTYLSDLKRIAKLSGQDYAVVLGEMMFQIQQSIAQLQPAAPVVLKHEQTDTKSPQVEPAAHSDPSVLVFTPPQPTPSTYNVASSSVNASGTVRLAPDDLNPPALQRYVVEHVVRSSDASFHSHCLRPFSGRTPRPNHEMDDDTWRSSVELLLHDPSVSDLQHTRLLCDNLLPPACDLVKHLNYDTLPEVYLQHLDSAYGTVQDGGELYAKFMDTFQNHGEKPSEYLQRLQVTLQNAVRRGGVSEKDSTNRLLA